MYDYENIKIAIENKIVTVALNRPNKKNAMSPELHREMDDVLSKLADDTEVNVLILTGSGDSFCAGMDLSKFSAEIHASPERAYNITKTVFSWYNKLRYFPKPTIASVNGWCFGAAFVLVTGCDLAIASEDAKFGLSEINLGMMPGFGATWSVAYGLLPKHAMYLILTGETIDGKEAARTGFVNKAVPAEKLWETSWALADKFRKMNPVALRSAREAFRKSKWMDLREAIEWEFAKSRESRYFEKSEWNKEGIQTFTEKKYKPGLEAYKKTE